MKIQKNTGLVLSGGGGRGSYEVGVVKYLFEQGIYPGIIAGTSVGAINGAAIASGMSIEDIAKLWLSIKAKNVYQYSLKDSFRSFFKPHMSSIFDSHPLEILINQYIDFERLKRSEVQLFITAVNVATGHLEVFRNQEITSKHLVASASIPIIFPCVKIGSSSYWDGGIIANTPITPVLEKGAKEIYTIILAPHGNDVNYMQPKNKIEAMERLLDFTLMGSFSTIFNSLSPERVSQCHYRIKKKGYGSSNLYLIEPKVPMGLNSVLNFTEKQSVDFMQKGYRDAKDSLESLLSSKKRRFFSLF